MKQKPAPQTMKALIEVADRQTFEKEVCVKTQLVTRALSEGVMPPRWFIAVREFCTSRGHAVPEHLFKWHEAGGGKVHQVPSPSNAPAQEAG